MNIDSWYVSTSSTTNSTSSAKASVTWMDNQHAENDSDTNTTTTTSALIEYYNHDSPTTVTEDSIPTEKHSAYSQTTTSISTHGPQFDNENSVGNICSSAGSPIHIALDTHEESNISNTYRLEHEASSLPGLLKGALMVATQSLIVER